MNCPDRLGLHPGPAMFRYVLPCPVSPPMSARSSSSSRSRRIGQHRTSRRVGTWRRPTRSQWSAMIRELASVAWMSCSGGSCRFGLRTSKVGFANINAKAEGIEGRPALREAFREHRQPPDRRSERAAVKAEIECAVNERAAIGSGSAPRPTKPLTPAESALVDDPHHRALSLPCRMLNATAQ